MSPVVFSSSFTPLVWVGVISEQFVKPPWDNLQTSHLRRCPREQRHTLGAFHSNPPPSPIRKRTFETVANGTEISLEN